MSSSKVRLVVAGGVLIAAVLAAAVFLLVRHGGAGPGEPPAGEGLWWEDLLRFVPAYYYPANDGQIDLVNPQALAGKLGTLDGRRAACDGIKNAVGIPPTDLIGPLIEPYARLPFQDDRLPAATALAQLAERVGFAFCDINRAVFAMPSFRQHFAVYEAGVSNSTVSALLLQQRYAEAVAGDAHIFSKGEDWDWSFADPASSLFLAQLNRIALLDGRVVRGPASQQVEDAVATRQGGQDSVLSDAGITGLFRALGDFDGAILLPRHGLGMPFPLGRDELVSEDTFKSSGVGFVPVSQWGRFLNDSRVGEWGRLSVPDRIAVAYIHTGAGEDVFKLALLYQDGRSAKDDRSELEKRLATWRNPSGEYNMCDSSAVEVTKNEAGWILGATCRGPQMVHWTDRLSRDFVLLVNQFSQD